MELNLIQVIAVYALPVIFAITLHEAAHGYVAKYFGDLTAYSQGRVSLNPIRHIDPIGTVAVPLILLAVSKFAGGGFIFGWAKPVPVNFGALRHPKRDMLWVAAAGPGANLAMMIFWALMVKLAFLQSMGGFSLPLALMGAAGVLVNAIFMVLNLLPIPPLDGGRIMVSLLPHRQAYQFSRIEPYGFFVIIGLLFLGVLGYVLWPVVALSVRLVTALVGVSDVDLNTLVYMMHR
ncbi:MAG: site-2 protease family protein [Betaproteobacteria bacterium]|nr:site-2 protease family protein [Betaproteobacteria bacterium]